MTKLPFKLATCRGIITFVLVYCCRGKMVDKSKLFLGELKGCKVMLDHNTMNKAGQKFKSIIFPPSPEKAMTDRLTF